MTSIEWTHPPGFQGETWNPIVGCSVVSPGCANCYAMKFAGRRLENNSLTPHYSGLTEFTNSGPVWAGKIAKAPARIFLKPLRWSPKKPRCVFVNSMGDLFHENVPDFLIDQVFAIMALAPHHLFLVLTKRAARMRDYVEGLGNREPAPVKATQTTRGHSRESGNPSASYLVRIASAGAMLVEDGDNAYDYLLHAPWPLPNVWLGVSAEDQRRADERIPDLLDTPAAKRFVSAEPLLGPIDFENVAFDGMREVHALSGKHIFSKLPFGRRLDWVITGGESGPGARPAHPDWIRSIRDQCASAGREGGVSKSGVPFFFKQWGEWGPDEGPLEDGRDPIMDGRARAAWWDKGDARWRFEPSGYHVDLEKSRGSGEWLYKLGKKSAGAMLDGAEHREWPL